MEYIFKLKYRLVDSYQNFKDVKIKIASDIEQILVVSSDEQNEIYDYIQGIVEEYNLYIAKSEILDFELYYSGHSIYQADKFGNYDYIKTIFEKSKDK